MSTQPSAGETETISGERDDGTKFVLYDGFHLPVRDKHFDLLICNSVLEHVPVAQRAQLAREIMRVSKQVFCQTPAYSFPIEPHFLLPFIHWLPKKLGFYLLSVSPWKIMSKPTLETANTYFFGTSLLRERELKALFPSCVIEYERVLGLVKSYFVLKRGGDAVE